MYFSSTNSWLLATLAGIAIATLGSRPATAARPNPAEIDVEAKIDADFPFQGEYTGEVLIEGKARKYGVQVVAQGGGRFRAVAFPGGLPGDGYDGGQTTEATGERKDKVVTISKMFRGVTITDGRMTVVNTGGEKFGELKHVVRTSPTLGAKPPKGAVILYDGETNLFDSRRITKDGYLMGPANCTQAFEGDMHLHLEFRLPYRLKNNSGIKGLAGFYEIQVLDSFAKPTAKNSCGTLYGLRPPSVNMTLPPLSWQTYDVDYTAARRDAAGNQTQRPVITVRHNGVVTHDEIKGNRRGGPVKLHLQWHSGIIHYRNIWLVKKDAK